MKLKLSTIVYIVVLKIVDTKAGIPVTILADNAYPPYAYEQRGEIKGIYTEILLEAFKQMPKYDITVQPVPWKRGLKLLEQGKSFALFPPYLRKKARPYIDPYSTPILAEQLIVVCRADVFVKGPKPNWPDDYIGLSIGRNMGFESFDDNFWSLVKQNKISVVEARNSRLNLLKLIKKRMPCYVNDKASIFWGLKQLELSNEYKPEVDGVFIQGAVLSSEWGFIGYTNQGGERFPFKNDFIKKLDIIINKMKENDAINNIVNKYISN